VVGASAHEPAFGPPAAGFRGFSWSDPEGNVWDVAWARGTTFDDRGGVTFP
jgi:hypothetical protein